MDAPVIIAALAVAYLIARKKPAGSVATYTTGATAINPATGRAVTNPTTTPTSTQAAPGYIWAFDYDSGAWRQVPIDAASAGTPMINPALPDFPTDTTDPYGYVPLSIVAPYYAP